ncbi:MAG: hypothetical protein WAK29_16880 [Terriglobales bacterium]
MTSLSKTMRLLLMAAAGAMTIVFTACPPPGPTPPLNPLTLLPTDASATCTVSPSTFATWFQTPSTPIPAPVNTVFAPANSVTFPNTPNCSFYQWAKQDFLWLTSPAPASYGGGGGLIVDSPTFYDVSPESNGSRTFLAHTPGFIRPFALRAAQVGPQGLQMLFDASGKPFQVQAADKGAKPLVRDVTGQTVEIAHVRVEKGKLVLLDATGKIIQAQPSQGAKPDTPAAMATLQAPTMLTAQKFIIDGIPIFIDPSLAVVDVEQGEADSGVLEAQPSAGGSLVYYATIVNDVYAYYATGVKDGAIAASQFPTTASDLSNVTNFASAHGKTFPDANALAIEVKSAWVEASGLPNAGNYITMTATIPTYNQSSPTAWTATGQQTVKLALVGMHVVGSAAGHPEMIWSTFEHVANAPAATYSYINAGNATVAVNQNVSNLPVIAGTATPWVFSAANSSGPFNQAHMSLSAPNITANSPFQISASDTIRWKAFGAATDNTPNPVDSSTAASNTEIISINNSVSGMLTSGDVRNNYVMTGATWTVNGFGPIGGGNNFPNCGVSNGCPVGTSALSNTTMETYQQGKDNTLANGGLNCLTCHSSNTTNVSHVFGALKPLF